jgi:AhpD family alkylhydroperoxidase
LASKKGVKTMNRPARLVASISGIAILLLVLASHFELPGDVIQAARSPGDNDNQEKMSTTAKYLEQLAKEHPEAMKGFQTLGQAVMKPGALDTKTKELIGLALAVAARCDACIAGHTRNAIESGATKEEIIEALGVTILMGGGPSLAYSTHALEAMEQFKKTEN